MTTMTAATAGPTGPASVSYDRIAYEPRVPVADGVFYEGEVTALAGAGKSGKGLTVLAYSVRVALGLSMPGEDREHGRPAGRVLWVSGGAEDDPIHDLAPRFQAAARQCAADFDLSEAECLAGLRYVHDLSEWPGGAPVEVPTQCEQIEAEVARLNELDAANRAPGDAGYAGPGPRVRFIVLDPIKGLLAPGHNLNSGARRVMTPLQRMARRTRAAVPVIMHVTKAGSIQGSADVTNALRLALTVKRGQDGQPSELTTFASNIAADTSVRFLVEGAGPDTRVVFIDAAAEAEAADLGTLRARLARQEQAAIPAGQELSDKAGDYLGATADAFRVLVKSPGQAGMRQAGRLHASRELARAAAEQVAGKALSWADSTARPGIDIAHSGESAYAVQATARTRQAAS
jgi:AAA domain